MDLSSLISQLKQIKDQLGSNFKELPFSSFQLEEQESQHSHHHHHSSSFSSSSSSEVFTTLQVSFHPSLEAQLPTDFDYEHKAFVLYGQSHTLQEEVAVKLSANVTKLEKEFNLLRHFYNAQERQVTKVLGTSIESFLVFTTSDGQSHSLFGLVMEKGTENMEAFLRERPSMLPLERRVLANKLVSLVSYLHRCSIVWMDLKTSNFVHFPNKHPDWRMIDFADGVEFGETVGSGQGFTSVYAAPEVVRVFRRGHTLTAHPRMDVWSVGVCLMEIASGRQLYHLLGMSGSEELEALYLDEDYVSKVTNRLDNMIKTTFKGKQSASFRKLLEKLLVVNEQDRTFTMQNVSNDSFFTLTATTTSSAMNTGDLLQELRKMLQDNRSNPDSSAAAREAFEDLQTRLASMSEEQRRQFESMEQHFERVHEEIEEVKESVEQRIEFMKNELMTKMASGQLPREDMMAFTQQLAALQTNPSSDDLQAIKDQLQEIFDRVSEQRN
jgi:serine/threonine protein kinase